MFALGKFRVPLSPATLVLAIGLAVGACRTTEPLREAPGDEGPVAMTEEGELTDVPPADAGPPADGQNVIVDEAPDRQGRPVRTYFYGAELIREKVEVDGIPVTRVSIVGGATIQHQGVYIVAPRIELVAGQKGRCVGGVTVRDPKNGVTIRAASAEYDRGQQRVELSGRPYLIQNRKGSKPTLVTTTAMVRDLAKSESILEGDVRIIQGEITIIGDRGRLIDAENRLILEDNPMIIGRDQFLVGKNLIYYLNNREIHLDGDVLQYGRQFEEVTVEAPPVKDSDRVIPLENFARNGARIFDPAGTRRTEKRAVLSLMSSQRIIYRFDAGGQGPQSEVQGDVLLTRGPLLIRTPSLLADGDDFSRIHTEKGVFMHDKEQHIKVRAGTMEFQRKEEHLRLESDPQIEFLKKDTGETTATLYGAVIERDFKEGRTQARGDVRIVRETYTASGELATYHEREDVVILEGDPRLKDQGGEISCEKVLLYPKKNRVLLMNRITGFRLD